MSLLKLYKSLTYKINFGSRNPFRHSEKSYFNLIGVKLFKLRLENFLNFNFFQNCECEYDQLIVITQKISTANVWFSFWAYKFCQGIGKILLQLNRSETFQVTIEKLFKISPYFGISRNCINRWLMKFIFVLEILSAIQKNLTSA